MCFLESFDVVEDCIRGLRKVIQSTFSQVETLLEGVSI
jgi:hypothetical protein